MKTDKVKEGAGKSPKWCKSNHSPPPTSRLVPSQSQNNGYFGKTKPTAFIVEHDVFWNELSFWSAILFMFLLPCCPSAACLWRDGAQWEISKHCSMTAETPVCYQCCYSHRYKTKVAVRKVTLSQQGLIPITVNHLITVFPQLFWSCYCLFCLLYVWRITVHSVSSVGLKAKLVHHLTCISHSLLLDSVIPGVQKIWIRTWGCSHNNSDGEYMAGQLAAYGYKITGNSMSEPCNQFF